MDFQEKAAELNRMHLVYAKELNALAEQVSAQGETGVLLSLSEHESPMFAGEFIEILGLTTGRIANILKRLEQKKLIRREFLAEDKRRVIVSLTPKGWEIARQKSGQMAAFHKKLLEYLGEEDAAAAVRIFEELMRCLKSQRKNF